MYTYTWTFNTWIIPPVSLVLQWICWNVLQNQLVTMFTFWKLKPLCNSGLWIIIIWAWHNWHLLNCVEIINLKNKEQPKIEPISTNFRRGLREQMICGGNNSNQSWTKNRFFIEPTEKSVLPSLSSCTFDSCNRCRSALLEGEHGNS